MIQLFLDIETTGKDFPQKRGKLKENYNYTNKDIFKNVRMLEICMITYDNNQFKDIFHEIIYFDFPINNSNVHGITNEICTTKGKKIEDIYLNILNILENSYVIIGHNIKFDMFVIFFELYNMDNTLKSRIDKIIQEKIYHDTMISSTNLCRIPNDKYYPGSTRYKYPSLDELYMKLFQNERIKKHRAKEDVEDVILCYNKLKEDKVLFISINKSIEDFKYKKEYEENDLIYHSKFYLNDYIDKHVKSCIVKEIDMINELSFVEYYYGKIKIDYENNIITGQNIDNHEFYILYCIYNRQYNYIDEKYKYLKDNLSKLKNDKNITKYKNMIDIYQNKKICKNTNITFLLKNISHYGIIKKETSDQFYISYNDYSTKIQLNKSFIDFKYIPDVNMYNKIEFNIIKPTNTKGKIIDIYENGRILKIQLENDNVIEILYDHIDILKITENDTYIITCNRELKKYEKKIKHFEEEIENLQKNSLKIQMRFMIHDKKKELFFNLNNINYII